MKKKSTTNSSIPKVYSLNQNKSILLFPGDDPDKIMHALVTKIYKDRTIEEIINLCDFLTAEDEEFYRLKYS